MKIYLKFLVYFSLWEDENNPLFYTFHIIHDQIKLSASPEKVSSVIIEPSKMGKSNFNSDFDWENVMYLTIHEKCACSSGYSEYVLKEKRFKAVSDCDQTNQQESSFHYG